MPEENIKINKLEKVVDLIDLIEYMGKNYKNYNDMIHKYNDISISVKTRSRNLNRNQRTLKSVSIMKEYLKDTSKEIHMVVNDYYNKK